MMIGRTAARSSCIAIGFSIGFSVAFSVASAALGESTLRSAIERLDRDHDGIHDSLSRSFRENKNAATPSIHSFMAWSSIDRRDQLAKFVRLHGGRVRLNLGHPIDGLAFDLDNMDTASIQVLLKEMIASNLAKFIEPDAPGELLMMRVARRLGVRPYVWTTLGLRGDAQMGVAVVDTGIDSSQAGFARPGAIREFFDIASNSALPAFDKDGHGTHVSGIIAAEFSPLDELGRLRVTESFATKIEGVYPQWLSFASAPGTLKLDVAWWGTGSLDWLDVRTGNNPGVVAGNGEIAGWTSVKKIVPAGPSPSPSLPTKTSMEIPLSDDGSWAHILTHRSGNAGDMFKSLRLQVTAHVPMGPEFSDGYPIASGLSNRSGIVMVRATRPSEWVEALNWIVENRERLKIGVVNLSQGTTSDTEALRTAVEHAVNAGIIVVAAAGNDGPGANHVSFPARYADTEAVAATDLSGALAAYSSEGGLAVGGSANTGKPDVAAIGGSGLFGGGVLSTDSNSGNTPGDWNHGHDAEPMCTAAQNSPTDVTSLRIVSGDCTPCLLKLQTTRQVARAVTPTLMTTARHGPPDYQISIRAERLIQHGVILLQPFALALITRFTLFGIKPIFSLLAKPFSISSAKIAAELFLNRRPSRPEWPHPAMFGQR
jgi:subtilisin family serine protease